MFLQVCLAKIYSVTWVASCSTVPLTNPSCCLLSASPQTCSPPSPWWPSLCGAARTDSHYCPKLCGSKSREAVVVGCHGRPCSTGLRLKSPCGMSDSTLSPIYPPYPCDSHTHADTHTHAHTQLTVVCSAATVSLGHLCSLPTQEKMTCVSWPKITARSTFLVSVCSRHTMAPGFQAGLGEGWLSGTFMLLGDFRKTGTGREREGERENERERERN